MKILISNLFTFFGMCVLGGVAISGAILAEPTGAGNVILAFVAGIFYCMAALHVSVEKMSESEIDTERKLKS